METCKYVITRFKVKAASMVIAFVLSISGIIMIFLQIKDKGSIDVRTPFITGQLQSGFVGSWLILISLVICIFCLFSKQSKNYLNIKNGNYEFHWEGKLTSSEDIQTIKDIYDRSMKNEGSAEQS